MDFAITHVVSGANPITHVVSGANPITHVVSGANPGICEGI